MYQAVDEAMIFPLLEVKHQYLHDKWLEYYYRKTDFTSVHNHAPVIPRNISVKCTSNILLKDGSLTCEARVPVCNLSLIMHRQTSANNGQSDRSCTTTSEIGLFVQGMHDIDAGVVRAF